TLLFFEEHAGHVGAVLDDKLVRMLPPHCEEKLAHAEAAAVSRLLFVVHSLVALDPERNQEHALGIGATCVDVVEIDRRHDARLHELVLEPGNGRPLTVQYSERGTNDYLEKGAVGLGNGGDKKWVDEIGRRPALETVSALVEDCTWVNETNQPAPQFV